MAKIAKRFAEQVILHEVAATMREIDERVPNLASMHPQVGVMFDIWLDTTLALVEAIRTVEYRDRARARNDNVLGRVP